MRRFSRSSSVRNSSNPQPSPSTFAQVGPTGSADLHSAKQQSSFGAQPGSAQSSTYSRSITQAQSGGGPVGGMGGPLLSNNPNDSRPISSATDQSFDYQPPSSGRPVTSHPSHNTLNMPLSPTYGSTGSSNALLPGGSTLGNLSRTDQIVLKHFWDTKHQENVKRDLHYLKFPFFPQFPSHKDLSPYCEIYHLVKTSPGATIISLGSTNGVYIGFELKTGSQLHIDMDDEWHNISHHKVQFRSYESMIRDPSSDVVFKTWPKPLTIEFLEEQYQKWCQDLMSLCWEGKEVRELGGGGGGGSASQGSTSGNGVPNTAMTSSGGGVGGMNGNAGMSGGGGTAGGMDKRGF